MDSSLQGMLVVGQQRWEVLGWLAQWCGVVWCVTASIVMVGRQASRAWLRCAALERAHILTCVIDGEFRSAAGLGGAIIML